MDNLFLIILLQYLCIVEAKWLGAGPLNWRLRVHIQSCPFWIYFSFLNLALLKGEFTLLAFALRVKAFAFCNKFQWLLPNQVWIETS